MATLLRVALVSCDVGIDVGGNCDDFQSKEPEFAEEALRSNRSCDSNVFAGGSLQLALRKVFP